MNLRILRRLAVCFTTIALFQLDAQTTSPVMDLMQMTSGTSMNPQSWPMPMLMPRVGRWRFMLMGQAFLVDTQQSGPRGGDKFYSTNWFMGSAEHSLGRGA